MYLIRNSFGKRKRANRKVMIWRRPRDCVGSTADLQRLNIAVLVGICHLESERVGVDLAPSFIQSGNS